MPILRAENLYKSFSNVNVLKGVGFTLDRGRVLSMIGSSGSGKTTLLRCLNFLETPDRGRIIVDEEVLFDAADPATHREADKRKKRLHFGLVFQNFNLFPQYTALKNVMLAKELLAKEQPDYRENKAQIQKSIIEEASALLDQVGLSDKFKNYPHELSGGQQQRVAIARALALHPDILCFDEPTSSLDPEISGDVLLAIQDLAKRNLTMIIVTHEMGFAREVSDHVIFLDGGLIAEEGLPEAVFGAPKSERLKSFLGAVL
ncbi:MAG: amino acid ABC transporter ATP-binding protein [Clostridiales bacterium]|nr:amino acid ABC transporter ATP-binding protein [Clostridiales bacterium]